VPLSVVTAFNFQPDLAKSAATRRTKLEVCLPSSARCSGTEAYNYGQCAIDFPKLAKREDPVGFA
jgi:hypothetical protein